MASRLFDIGCAVVGLLCAAPVLAAAALGIRLASPGPVLYRARRVGRHGRIFTMVKLRTMHCGADARGGPITGVVDERVFPFGRLLRQLKIDELPQLWHVLRGEMAVIGPRPEDPAIVDRHYGREGRETLAVRPGLASPGSLYHDSHGHLYLEGDDPAHRYVESLLPVKIALDRVYVARASLWYDLRIVARTLRHIGGRLVGRPCRTDPPEMNRVRGPAGRRAPADGRAVAALLLVAVTVGCRPHETGGAPAGPEPEWLTDSAAVLFVGAGDIARCDSEVDERTAALLDEIPGTVFTTGDHAYPDGSAEEFTECYAPGWGRHRDRTRPAPGNHDYHTDGAAGYFGYFGAAAGRADRGYYSYRLGHWLILALNTQLDIGPDSPQLAWVRAELGAHRARCALAYWHEPLFSSGRTHGSAPRVRGLWDVLYGAGVDVVLAGHEHHYERFRPQTPDGRPDSRFGIRQFVVGTGGGSTYGFGRPLPMSQVRRSHAPGVLVLHLQPDRYAWRFLAVPTADFTDAGADRCHDPPGAAGGA